MSQSLPTGDFKWEDPDNYDWRNASSMSAFSTASPTSSSCKANQTQSHQRYTEGGRSRYTSAPLNRGELFIDNGRGCIVECDLEYPLNTGFKTSKFPLAPEKLKINESDLSEYQKRCLKVENKKVGNVAKLILNLIAVLNNVSSVKFDKPIYLGMCVLDYSKLWMYIFYYEVINKLWPNNEIIGFDTDSFFLDIYTEDIYEDMKKISEHLDTSNYGKDHPLFSKNNKKVIGKFKDELGGKIMTELVFLRSKAYAFKFEINDNESDLTHSEESGEVDDEVKKLKGITKSTIKHDITFQNFKDAIIKPYEKVFYKKMYVLNSEKHEMFVKEINKKAISPFDDKRWISINGIDTYSHGYDKLIFL